MDGYAVDHTALKADNGDVSQKLDFAARQHLKGSDGVGVREAGIEIVGVHSQPYAVGLAFIVLRASRAATDCQGAHDNSNNVSARRLRCIDALRVAAVKHVHPVRRKVAATDSDAA